VNGPGFEIHAGVLRFQRRFRKLFVSFHVSTPP
jgi:hypothetical protein